jgi:hypothetical protein
VRDCKTRPQFGPQFAEIVAADAVQIDPDLLHEVPDFPAKTWRALREAGKLPPSRVNIPYSPRQDGTGHDVPNGVLKEKEEKGPVRPGKAALGPFPFFHTVWPSWSSHSASCLGRPLPRIGQVRYLPA